MATLRMSVRFIPWVLKAFPLCNSSLRPPAPTPVGSVCNLSGCYPDRLQTDPTSVLPGSSSPPARSSLAGKRETVYYRKTGGHPNRVDGRSAGLLPRSMNRMDLYLIRHADALPLGVQGFTEDGARPLSDEGRAQAKALGEALSAKGIRLDKIATSPLVRARQTADGLLAAWSGSTPELVVCEELVPGSKRRKLARFLRQLGGNAVAVVGHQPDLGRFAGWLIGSKK